MRLSLFLCCVSFFSSGCGILGKDDPDPKPKMVAIPSGGESITLGDPQGRLVENRTVQFTRDFLMDETEVTRGRYLEIMGKSPFSDSLDYPMTSVTWFDALLFCNARSKAEGLDTVYTYDSVETDSRFINGMRNISTVLLRNLALKMDAKGYRLPTSAEWEFAMMGGATTYFFWGDDTAGASEYAWFANGPDTLRHPVRQKKPNPYGLYDILGNASELLTDAGYRSEDSIASIDPVNFKPSSIWTGHRGSFSESPADDGHLATYTVSSIIKSQPMRYVGFRCILIQ